MLDGGRYLYSTDIKIDTLASLVSSVLGARFLLALA